MKTKTLSFSQLLQANLGSRQVKHWFNHHGLKNRNDIFKPWYQETGEGSEVYPSQGLLKTPYDFLPVMGKLMMSEEELWEVLKMRRYLLEIFNHPERLAALDKVSKTKFIPPPVVPSRVMEFSVESGLALSVRDLGSRVVGTDKPRKSRRKILQNGPFVKLGKYARVPFSAGAMPDVFGAPAALATMMMCHALAGVPRNGLFNQVGRQVDLVKATFDWLEREPLLEGRPDAKELVERWRRNLVGVVEPELKMGMKRVKALYQAGVRVFRVYSPEPGKDAVEMVKAIQKLYGETVEIMVGQVVSVTQAQILEEAGAEGIYIGIGGGGRCITAVRSGSAVDWPNLLWRLRGKIKIPVIVEGGASDQVGVTLLLGASGIGVTRAAAGGTIESPGGLIYWVDKEGRWFKPYGGEASARTKYLDGKMLALGLPAFVEGETRPAIKGYVPYVKPTIAEHMYLLIEDVVLSMVFRGVESIPELQAISPSPLRQITEVGMKQQGTH